MSLGIIYVLVCNCIYFFYIFILSVGLSDAKIAWTVGSSVAVGMVTDYLSLKNSNGWSDAKYIQGDGLSDAKSMV